MMYVHISPLTVDGRNPAPVDVENLPLFTRFFTFQVVVWDFFHQQYHPVKGPYQQQSA